MKTLKEYRIQENSTMQSYRDDIIETIRDMSFKELVELANVISKIKGSRPPGGDSLSPRYPKPDGSGY